MRIVKEMKIRYMQDGTFDLSAQVAYYLMLSFFPFLLLAVTLIGYLPYSSESILFLVKPYLPFDAYQLIESHIINILDEDNHGILSFSLIATLYPASLVFQSMIRTLNRTYKVTNKRPLWRQFLLGFVFMFGLLGTLMISVLFPIFVRFIGDLFGELQILLPFWTFIRWLVSSFVLFLIFWAFYLLAPTITLTLRKTLPGAIFSTVGWQLISFGFSYYVTFFGNYSLIYGNVGAIIVLLVWFYLSAMILIMGGQLNAVLDKLHGEVN